MEVPPVPSAAHFRAPTDDHWGSGVSGPLISQSGLTYAVRDPETEATGRTVVDAHGTGN